MAQADTQEVLAVDFDKLFNTITKYEDYPKFVDGCKTVKVDRKGDGHTRVTYHVSMIKDITYTLDHQEDRANGRVDWTLVEGDVVKKNVGFWQLKNLGAGKTEARYHIDIEFSIPVPGMILSRLVKGSLPAMIRSFRDQANKS